MWQDGYRALASPSSGWAAHHRFLADLFTVLTPATLTDATGGPGAAVAQTIVPSLVISAEPPTDLVLADGSVPQELPIGQDTLVLIRDWDGDGDARALPNGLAVVAGENWGWIVSEPMLRWMTLYANVRLDDEGEFREGQTEQLQQMLAGHQQRVELLEKELLQTRDELAQLLPLEVSPKAQLSALRRSLPVSVRKRLPRRQQRQKSRTTGSEVPDTQLMALKGLNLDSLLSRHYDPAWVGLPLDRYVNDGLLWGEPVSRSHAEAIAPRPAASESATDWGPVELVGPAQRRVVTLPDVVDELAPELLTVDVWDTLLVRDRPADAAKLATARRLVLRPDVARGHPDLDVFEVMAMRVSVEAQLAASDPMQEYRLAEVIARTLTLLVGTADEAAVAQLVAAEVHDEIMWTRARPDVAALAGRPRLAIASDFYMTGDDLARIVGAADGRWSEVPVYVSVERGCSKRLSGSLLDLIRRDFDVSADRHVHIGDNVHSDVAMQVKAGGSAVQVRASDRFPAPGEFGPDDLAMCDEQLRRQLAAFDEANPCNDMHRLAGRATSPLAVAVVAAGLEKAYRSGVDRVHYVSREGIFLAQVHEMVEPILRPPGGPEVKAIHLALSRRATFGASLEAPYRFSLQRMWSMYARQSPRAMLLSIGVQPEDYAETLAAAGLQLDEVLTDARRDARVERFLADPAVESQLGVHVRQARSLLQRYVASQTSMTDPFILVDVGWRGTIQDNLVRALGLPASEGVYFGLFPYLNAQPPGSNKTGVAFDGNLGEAFAFADPPAVLERPWTPDVPSTIGFRDEAGEIAPVYAREPGDVSPGIAEFQAGSLEVADLVGHWFAGFGLTTSASRPLINGWAQALWSRPPAGVADIWFSSDHDDSFGALNQTGFRKDRPSPQWLTGDLYKHVQRGMVNSGWPQGYRSWRPVASLIELGNL